MFFVGPKVHIFRRLQSTYSVRRNQKVHFFGLNQKCIFFNGLEVLCSARLAAALLLSLLHALFLRLLRLQGLTNQPGGRSVSAHFGFGFGFVAGGVGVAFVSTGTHPGCSGLFLLNASSLAFLYASGLPVLHASSLAV